MLLLGFLRREEERVAYGSESESDIFGGLVLLVMHGIFGEEDFLAGVVLQ